MSLLSDNSLGAEICDFGLRVAQILQNSFSMFAEDRSPVAYFTGSVRKLHRCLHNWGSVRQAGKFNWLKQTLGGNVWVIQNILR